MTIPTFTTIQLDVEGHLATVTLDRPGNANAMNLPMWSELQSCFQWLDAEPAVRAIVLAGEGKHFCSGLDLSVFADLANNSLEPSRQSEQLRQTILRLQANLTAIESCRKPVLAAIHYTCIGGAIDMISCCDMRYCTADAYFSIKEIDLGMTADVGTLQRLPHIIGQGVLRELAYTGREINAEEALSIGLVNRVFSDWKKMMAEVKQIAATIASKSPLAIRGTKEMLLYSRDHSVADSLNYVATWNAGMLCSADVMKSIEASTSSAKALFED